MRRVFTTALLSCAAALSLASPGRAQQATAQLQVIPYVTGVGQATDTELDLTFPAAAAATARVVAYVPTGYTSNLAHPAGTKVADVSAAVDARGTRVPLQGQAVAANPADHASQACAPGVHAAVWVIQLVTQARTLSIPMYVDPTSGSETALGAYRIHVCFASPDVPEEQGGAPLGAKVTLAEIDFLNVFTNPPLPNLYVWRALVTPYVAGTATPNAPATYELRSIAFIPVVFTVRARYDRRTRVATISGRIALSGIVPPTITVPIIGGATADVSRWKVVGRARGRRGSFALRTKRLRRTTFVAGFIGPVESGCVDGLPPAAPAGCVRETTAPVFSNRVRVVVPRRR